MKQMKVDIDKKYSAIESKVEALEKKSFSKQNSTQRLRHYITTTLDNHNNLKQYMLNNRRTEERN